MKPSQKSVLVVLGVCLALIFVAAISLRTAAANSQALTLNSPVWQRNTATKPIFNVITAPQSTRSFKTLELLASRYKKGAQKGNWMSGRNDTTRRFRRDWPVW